MAANGAEESFAVADVLAGVLTMRSGDADSKKKAHEYLQRFQKSVCQGYFTRDYEERDKG